MEKFRKPIDKVFLTLLIIAAICAIFLLVDIHYEELCDDVCENIESFDNEYAKKLIGKHININDHGDEYDTMLMSACKSGNSEMIIYLIENGANPNLTVFGKMTPLELFCFSGYEAGEEALIALLDAGAKQSTYSIKPAVFILADNYRSMNLNQKMLATNETVLMLKYGAPLGYGKNNLLHLAAEGNMFSLFNTIAHSKDGIAMINDKNSDGLTPWEVAVKHGSIDVQRVIRNLEVEYEEDERKRQEEEAKKQQELEQEKAEEDNDDTMKEGTVDDFFSDIIGSDDIVGPEQIAQMEG